eukprot:Sspe_Gene.67346::Locus_39740_Transcript_1_1_Confidence_1.000_Length_542::g.67346::m.67346/K16465/CETN1; centrin-1
MSLSMEQIKEAFHLFDTDGSGAIDNDEMALAMKALGFELSKEEITEMIRAVDKDSNSLIEYDEFEKMLVSRMTAKDSDEEIKRAFDAFDLDKSGTVSVDNLVAVAKKLGEDAEGARERLAEYVAAASNGGSAMEFSHWQQVMHEMRGR